MGKSKDVMMEGRQEHGNFVNIYSIVMHSFIKEPYVHLIAEQGPRAVLEPTLVGSTVQNSRKHRIQRQLLLRRGVIKAPAPAAAVCVGGGRNKNHLLSTVHVGIHTDHRPLTNNGTSKKQKTNKQLNSNPF